MSSDLTYPGPEAEPVRAWDVLEAKAAEHAVHEKDAREEYEAFTERLQRVGLAIQYHARGVEECLSAADALRVEAGELPLRRS